MSRHHIEKVTCPSCHHEGDFELWDSINTALDPEMKEKVLNQSIFLYTCPSCGETFRLNYSTLYHQMEDLVMIYLVPESEVEKTYEMFYGENALADYRTEKYLYRIVTSANQLVEKIQIFDAGKDDRVMELVKLLATDSILKNDPDIEFDELRFAVDDDGTNILVIINKGEITGAVDIDNMYEFASSHCNDFKELRDDDELIEVKTTDNEKEIILVTKFGQCIRFKENDVRTTGRVSMGVRGINLLDGDEVVGMQICTQGDYLLVVSENGMGKRTPMAEFTVQLRGGKGVKCYKITEKTGNLIGSKAVNEDNEIMMITTEGIIIRTPCSGISVMGRITSGVKLMDVDGEIKVASIAKVRDKEASEETSVSEKENETASEKTQE